MVIQYLIRTHISAVSSKRRNQASVETRSKYLLLFFKYLVMKSLYHLVIAFKYATRPSEPPCDDTGLHFLSTPLYTNFFSNPVTFSLTHVNLGSISFPFHRQNDNRNWKHFNYRADSHSVFRNTYDANRIHCTVM